MKKGNTAVKLLGTSSLGMGLVILLFLTSEQQVHRNNAFTRRYPPHPVIKAYDLDIGYNSYYIAGFDQDLLYLGNRTAPWHLLQIHLGTQDTTHIRMEPMNKELRYRSLQTKVLPPYFFVMDGSIPFILRGSTQDWKAHPWMEGQAYFTRAVPIDSSRIFIRTISTQTQKTALGLIENRDGFSLRLDTTLLQAQMDGVFDVDGILLNSSQTAQIGYVYYYRNQFMTFDTNLKKTIKQRTIDTVEQAKLKIAEVNSKGQVQMQAPPLTVNKTAYMDNNLVLIQSDRLGKNESRDMLDQAAIIDVYDHLKGTYEFSFYLYHIQKHMLREFALHNKRVIALIDDKVSVYQTIAPYFNPTTTESTKESTGL